MGEGHPTAGAAVLGISRSEAFDVLHETFQTAARAAGGVIESDFELAGAPSGSRLAGAVLEVPITRALAHRAPRRCAGCTVCAWDNVATGTSIPFPGLEWWVRGQAESSDGAGDGQIRSYYQASIPALSVLDTSRNLALHCIRDAAQVPYFEAAAPLRWIVTSWMARHGRRADPCGSRRQT